MHRIREGEKEAFCGNIRVADTNIRDEGRNRTQEGRKKGKEAAAGRESFAVSKCDKKLINKGSDIERMKERHVSKKKEKKLGKTERVRGKWEGDGKGGKGGRGNRHYKELTMQLGVGSK